MSLATMRPDSRKTMIGILREMERMFVFTSQHDFLFDCYQSAYRNLARTLAQCDVNDRESAWGNRLSYYTNPRGEVVHATTLRVYDLPYSVAKPSLEPSVN